LRRLTLCLLLALLAGCATDLAFQEGKRLIENGRVDEGLARVGDAAARHPDNAEYRGYYLRARDLQVNQLAYEADKARLTGQLDDALRGYRRALELNPDSARTRAGVGAVAAELRQRDAVAGAQALFESGKPDEALARVKRVLAANPAQRDAQALQRAIEEARLKAVAAAPRLEARFRKPVTLEFRDAPLKSVFEVLSKASGINFIFDRDVRPDLRATLFVRDTSIEDAVNFLLVTNQLDKRVLNDNTLLVYPNLPNKAKDYQDLSVRSFYLANADVKQTLNLIKTVVKTRDVFIDERLNLLVMRDTPEAIRLAEQLIAAQDLAEPEVILEVEVLEVQRSRLQELGARYPTQVSAGLEGAGGPGEATLAELKGNISPLTRINVTDPALVLNLRRQDGNTNLLANPRIRVKNREKAKIHIGDRLPVITTTSTANVGVSESVQYLDVGLKLDVENNVYLDDQVMMKVGLEVSNIVQEIRSQNGTLTYRLGTRNTATVLRVGNGETQVLAGLIQDEDRRTADKVPGLADLPLVGRLFSSHNDTLTKTEIVLLITPYVVRNIDRPGPAALQFTSGTEANFDAPPLRLSGTTASGVSQLAGGGAIPVAAVQALDVAPSPAGAPLPGTGQTLLLSAPLQAQAGREFAIALSAPPGAGGALQVELVYDPARLEAVGADGGGTLSLQVSGTATQRFRALPGQTGPASIAVASISAGDGGGDERSLEAPPPVMVDIRP
jgi:general secretion pathway protein D